MSTATLSQISSFPCINRDRNIRLRKSPLVSLPSRFKFSVCMHLDGSGTQTPNTEIESTLGYANDASKIHGEGAVNSYSINDEAVAGKLGINETSPEVEGVASQKKTAKIHDFCLGIPFGGLVLSGGLVGSLFSRNITTLGFGILFGGGLLALSTFSLKVWKQGKSSLPFILGQAAFATVLLWKYFQNYSLTKKMFPTGLYALISAAMLCFYSYVLASGGNPPPKKSKVPATEAA